MTPTDLEWRTASYCDVGHCVAVAWRRSTRCDSGTCVDIGLAGQVHVRDSKQPDAGTLTFGYADWTSFLAWIRETL